MRRAAGGFRAVSLYLFLLGSEAGAANQEDFVVHSSSGALRASAAGTESAWSVIHHAFGGGPVALDEQIKARPDGKTTATADILGPPNASDGDRPPRQPRKAPQSLLGTISDANGRETYMGGTSNTAQASHEAETKRASPWGESSPIGGGFPGEWGGVFDADWRRRLRGWVGLAPPSLSAGGSGSGDRVGNDDHRVPRRNKRRLRAVEEDYYNAEDHKTVFATPPATGNAVEGGGGRESTSRVAASSLANGGDSDGVARRGSTALTGVVGGRRGLLVECPEGYFGEGCTECAAGFTETDDGLGCEPVSEECTIADGFRAVFFIGAAILLVMFTLDALWNAKSPARRVAQMWRVETPQSSEDAAAMSDSSGRSPKQQLALSRCASSKSFRGAAWSADEGCCDGVCWGREGLGRFFQGFMVFIVTAQIMTQGAEVMELEFPSAMQRALSALQWTNFDPQSLVGSCVLPELPYFDRVNGTIGLLTACLGALFLSHASLSLGGASHNNTTNNTSGNSHADHSLSSISSSSNGSKSYPSARFLDARSAAMDHSRGNGGSSSLPRDPSRGSAVARGDGGWGVGVRLEQQGGVWERWSRWSSGERHACAAVVVSLVMYPVVCTTLLRVWDCWKNDEGAGGRWLRADTNVQCSSDEHKTYQMIAACFLGLYGVGLPLALLAMTQWAKSTDIDDNDNPTSAAAIAEDDDEEDDNDTTVAVRRLRGGALLQHQQQQQGGGGREGGIPSAGPPRGFPPLRGGGGARETRADGDVNPTTTTAAAADVENNSNNNNFVGSTTSSATLSGGEEGERDVGGEEEDNDRTSGAQVRTGGQAEPTSPVRGCGGGGGGGCCMRVSESKAWRASGRRVLATRKAMSSKPDKETSRTSKRWRTTIPVWSPYRTDRHWFAAWELSRRLLLTGMLTFVSPDRKGEEYLRVTVACLVAGVGLVVGEVARPHRDPWICWIYRAGGVIILLMNLAGLIQKAGAANVQSPSMILLSVLLIVLLIIMAVFVCGGWRLSCAEQDRNAAVSAAIIPRGAGSSSALPGHRLQPSAGGAPLSMPAVPGSREKKNKSTAKAPPRRLWSGDRHNPNSEDSRPRGKLVMNPSLGNERPGSDRGDGTDFVKRLPTYHELARYSRSDSGLVAPLTSSKHRNQSSADSAVHVVNPMFSSCSATATPPEEVDAAFGSDAASRYERSSAGSGSSGKWRRSQHQQRGSGPFDRYMLSRSPKHPRASTSAFDGGGACVPDRGSVVERGVFSSVSGSGSASMKSSIDAHLTANGGKFYSNTETIGVGPTRSRSNSGRNSFEGLGDVDGIGGAELAFERQNQARASVELSSNGSTCSARTTPSVTATAAAVAAAAAAAGDGELAPKTRAPVLAPGAPTIDGHARRFNGTKQQLEGSSSSFASTSFESGTTGGNRALRNEQARVLANWRRSTGTSGYPTSSRSSRIVSRVSSGGGASVTFGPPRPTTSRSSSGAASGIGKVRGLMFRRNSSDASGSFLSQGSSSVASWRSPTGRSPVTLREAYSRNGSSGSPVAFEITPAAAAAAAAAIAAEEAEPSEDGHNPIVGDSSNLGSNWVPTQTARGGWPLDLPSSSAMPRWWVKYASRSGGDSSQSDLAAGAPPDLVLAAAERAKAAEREAAAARVEAVFGDDNNDPERRFSNADGGSNIVDFRAFVRAGGSGTSSFDSRATTASSEASRRRESGSGKATDSHGTEQEKYGGKGGGGNPAEARSSGDGGRSRVTAGSGVDDAANTRGRRDVKQGGGQKPPVRSRSSMSSGAADPPLTCAELKQYLDPDFEDEGAVGEGPTSFIRVAERVDKINAKVGIKRGGSIQQLSPLPWPASRGPV